MEQFTEGVLILDDEADYVIPLVQLINMEGVPAFGAQTPDEANEILAHEKIFLMLVDFRLGRGTGLDFYRDCKAAGYQIDAVLVTAYADKEASIEALRLGVRDILEKPFSSDKVKEIVRHFKKSRLAQIEKEKASLIQIREIYVQEASMLLEHSDTLVMDVEHGATDPKTAIECLYRKIHTIKGSSGVIEGTESILKVAHKLENLLSNLRKNPRVFDSNETDTVLLSLDTLKILIDQMQQPADGAKISIDETLASIDSCLQSTEVSPSIAFDDDGIFWVTKPTEEKTSVQAQQLASDELEKGVSVSNEKLDRLMEISGELVVLKNNLDASISRNRESDSAGQKGMDEFAKNLSFIVKELQREILSVRKVHLERNFNGLRRIVRSLSKDSGKRIDLCLLGGELEMDKTIVRALNEALIHLVRNSCDHGIETPEVRVAAGKTATGTLTIRAALHPGVVEVIVEDDGRGIDREKLREKAIASGQITPHDAAKMSEQEVLELIFRAGLSTAEQVSEVSGRGVGMDAVRTTINQLQGTIDVKSTLGQGSRIEIRIPEVRSVMIEKLLIFEADQQTLGIPASGISRITAYQPAHLIWCESRHEVLFDDKLIPFISLTSFLKNVVTQTDRERLSQGGTMVVVRHGTHEVALHISGIREQIHAVVRPFPSNYCEVPASKGVALLPENRLAFVLDPEQFVKAVKRGPTRRH